MASYSDAEIDPVEFEKQRRKLRGEIISHKNEGELFLMKPGQASMDVRSLSALRKCYKAMDGDLFKAPVNNTATDENQVKDEIIAALKEFRAAMRDDFGNKWYSAE